MALLPKIKIKTLVSFPSNVYGGTGIDVVKANGNFTINLDYSEFGTSGTLPPNTNTLVWDPVTNTYYLVPSSAAGGISDAPTDSKLYGRENAAWVDAWASPVLTGNPTAPTPTAGDNDTSIATTAFVASAVSTVTVSGGVTYTPQSPTVSQQTIARQNIYAAPFDALAYSGMQVNGSFEVDQPNAGAAISVPAGAQDLRLMDSWLISKDGTSTFTVQQAGSVFGPGKELKLTVGTSQPTIGGNYIDIRQYIEGYRIARLGWGGAAAQPLTIAFWVRSSVAGNLPVFVANPGFAIFVTGSVTINAANVAQFVTVTLPAQTTGGWPADNGIGLILVVRPAVAGSINIVATSGNTFEIANVVVLPGIEAPSAARAPFIMRPFADELAICQRYYEKSYDIAVKPGAPADNGSLYLIAPPVTAGIGLGLQAIFRVRKRLAPSMTWYSTNSGASGKLFDPSNSLDYTAVLGAIGETASNVFASNTSTTGQLKGNFVADIRL